MLGYIYVRLYLYTLQFAHKLITCYDCTQYVVSLFRFFFFSHRYVLKLCKSMTYRRVEPHQPVVHQAACTSAIIVVIQGSLSVHYHDTQNGARTDSNNEGRSPASPPPTTPWVDSVSSSLDRTNRGGRGSGRSTPFSRSPTPLRPPTPWGEGRETMQTRYGPCVGIVQASDVYGNLNILDGAYVGDEPATLVARESGAELCVILPKHIHQARRFPMDFSIDNCVRVLSKRFEERTDADNELLLRTIQHIDFFRQVPPSLARRLCRFFTLRSYAVGETVYTQGDPGRSMGVVLRGTGDIRIKLEDQTKVRSDASASLEDRTFGRPFGMLAAGDSFGEWALIQDTPRLSTIVCSTPLLLMVLGKEHYESTVRVFNDTEKCANPTLIQAGVKHLHPHPLSGHKAVSQTEGDKRHARIQQLMRVLEALPYVRREVMRNDHSSTAARTRVHEWMNPIVFENPFPTVCVLCSMLCHDTFVDPTPLTSKSETYTHRSLVRSPLFSLPAGACVRFH